jgi:hypothetical protein
LAIATWTRTSGARSIKVDAFESVSHQVESGIDKEKASVVRFLQPNT